MTKEKFTQGEWSVLDKSELGKNETNNIVRMESKKKNRYNTVPYACIGGFPDENAKEEIEANTHLISAAPEMYRMLESLKKELWQMIDEVNEQRLNTVHPQIETPPDLVDMETIENE